ncbi:tubulin-specific chaperone-like protein Rbl2 [Acephala macrosclerotiorum]|nr:tubulin-specific chaperone-like protein Rbl2 [Acephala macrosclerotiorum]
MAPPSALAIATSSVQRLMKEEASYHKELKNQEARLEKLLASKTEDENAEYQLKQERTAIEETKAVFPPLTERLEEALHKLEDKLDAEKSNSASAEEVSKAEGVMTEAKKVIADAKAAAASK